MAALPDFTPHEAVPVRLMNTIWADRTGVHDALPTPAALQAWWRLVRPDDEREPAPDDLDSWRELRAALRRLAADAAGDTRPGALDDAWDTERALRTVNRLLTRRRPTIGSVDGRVVLSWDADSDGPAASSLAEVAYEGASLLAADGRPVRACQGPGCVLYFVQDTARRQWCSSGCGNRARVARHHERHRVRRDG